MSEGEIKALRFSDGSEMKVPESPTQDKNSYVRTQLKELVAKIATPKDQILWKMMEGSPFFSAPASSRKEYHGCYPGGLAEHTLLVVKHMLKLNEAWEAGLDEGSIVLTGILHDIAKAGFDGKPYYLGEESEWHRNKLGQIYKYNKEQPAIGQNTKSLVIALRAGIELATDEIVAIMGQDGLFTDEGKSVFMSKGGEVPRLAYVMHMADWWCSQVHGI